MSSTALPTTSWCKVMPVAAMIFREIQRNLPSELHSKGDRSSGGLLIRRQSFSLVSFRVLGICLGVRKSPTTTKAQKEKNQMIENNDRHIQNQIDNECGNTGSSTINSAHQNRSHFEDKVTCTHSPPRDTLWTTANQGQKMR
jgi:hypothetical protein